MEPEITIADIDYSFEITRLVIGSIGTLVYFMCVKYEFLDFELDDPQKNSNAILNNRVVLVFFCFVGGLIPILMDIRQPFGWFIQGFILRATLTTFLGAAGSKEKLSGGLDK